MASVVKDDVDRLFECFKCGISPPQSAAVSRKRRKSKLKQGSSEHEVSGHADNLSPTSTGQSKLNETNKQLIVENHDTSKEKDSNREKYFSPVIFYGSPHGVPPKRPSSLLRLLHEIRIDLATNNELKLRRELWATFPRQEEAIKFVAQQHTHVRIFSYQNHYNGQRRFLVAAYEEFWRRYKSMDSQFRHHYEVIQEGLPCHLYFDLEYCKRVNTEKNGDDMVDLLISVMFEALHEKYSIQGNRDWIIELDSSTEEKFSRHLILRIPKTAFKDNSHAGAFVVEICSRIRGSKEGGRFHGLFVKKDASSIESSSQLFVDTAVYSRNRCFRLVLSSKAGKTFQLLPTNRFSCMDMRDKDVFMASLICNIDVDCEKLLVCRMELECAKTLHFETEANQNFGRYCSVSEESLNHCLTNVSASYLVGKSPIPSVDNFVEFVASIGNVPGKIRSWYWFSEYGLMVYSMSRNRYCERIGREHKSNHVIYVVDLRREVYYQKCHDPDCKGYRSPLRPVPFGIISVPWSLADSVEVVKDRELTHNRISSLLLDDEHMYLQLSNEESISEVRGEDSWWLDAARIADSIERRRNVKNLNFEDNDSLVRSSGEVYNHLNNPASTALQTQAISG